MRLRMHHGRDKVRLVSLELVRVREEDDSDVALDVIQETTDLVIYIRTSVSQSANQPTTSTSTPPIPNETWMKQTIISQNLRSLLGIPPVYRRRQMLQLFHLHVHVVLDALAGLLDVIVQRARRDLPNHLRHAEALVQILLCYRALEGRHLEVRIVAHVGHMEVRHRHDQVLARGTSREHILGGFEDLRYGLELEVVVVGCC